jgi:DNA-directed RNA polymerase subunit RPC12/RpoP
MAFESVNYQCPACGGPLHFASAEQKLVCDYCDSRFEVEEVEALYRERQDKADAKADAAAATPKPAADDAVQELAQNAGYICSSCGAELVSDGTVAVTTCPYCGNPAVAPGQLSGDFSPDLVIPFKLGRDDVTAALKEHYKGKILLPKNFVTGNHIDEVQGVYVPFWLYGARVDGEVYFDATNETVTEESDRTVTTTDHYDAYRKGNISFKRVPVDGSSKMPDDHMDAIEPFDYDALRPFSVAYMPGYIANRYDEDCETCKARAERRMEESTISALRETVVDEYDDATVESKQLDYTWEDSDYALFPVWMLLGENAFDPDYLAFNIEGILINIIAPLIIVIIGDVLLVGQLKTANEATHADEYCGELDLTEKHDTFSHTETTVVMKDDKDD